MLARCENSDGLGAIYPPMMYAIMALDALGYPADHPASQEARYQFDRLMIDDGKRFLFQPCFSPIWDTGIADLRSAKPWRTASGGGAARAADWILSKEVRVKATGR